MFEAPEGMRKCGSFLPDVELFNSLIIDGQRSIMLANCRAH